MRVAIVEFRGQRPAGAAAAVGELGLQDARGARADEDADAIAPETARGILHPGNEIVA